MGAYLDHAATSPMPEPVLEAYTEALRTVGNPASTHRDGQRANMLLEEARERVSAALGCDRPEVVFTGGGTESVNLGIKGMFWAAGDDAPVILVADGEHHATLESAEWLEQAQGAELVPIPIDAEGRVTPEALSAAIAAAGAERVALATFLWANNEVGTINPIADLCGIADDAGIPVHVDAVAALGQAPVDFAASGAAAMSVSAHKIGGPVGVGALVLGRRTRAASLLHGGSQQRSRSGTQDAAGAVGFAAALDSVMGDGTDPSPAHLAGLAQLRDRLIAGVRKIDPGAVLRGAAVDRDRLPGNAHFTFPGCQGDSLVYLLDAQGVSASVGSACQAGVAEISHVLLDMGLPEEIAAGALRFTLGASTAEDDIDALLDALPAALDGAHAAGLA